MTSDATRLRSAIRALVRRFSVSERADVACCGMTVAQAAALEALHDEDGLRLGELGRRLGIAPSTLTRNLARLEAKGLIRRDGDPDDARAGRVALTAAGRTAARELETIEETFAEGVLAHLPVARRKRIVEDLEDLMNAVCEATEGCCPGAYEHLMERSRR